jgi:hypothetical protein
MTFHIVVNGKSVGPLDLAGMRTRVKAGELTVDTFVWRPGMKEWLRAKDFPELRPLFAAPAPTPVTPPVQEVNPFDLMSAKAGESPAAPYGEETRFFIAQAGVNRRNPFWKIALFITSLILVPILILWFLSALKVVPLEVTEIDEEGRETKKSVFSREGVSGLGALLLGKSSQSAEERVRKRKRRQSDSTSDGTQAGALSGAKSGGSNPLGEDRAKTGNGAVADFTGNPSGLTQPGSLQAHYEDGRKQDIQPRLRKRTGGTSNGRGPSPEDVRKVVAQSQPAFQFCIDAELRKNPSFKGGRVHLVATIAGSGMVTGTSLDRRDLDRSELGKCLKTRARRMVFSAFGGDPVDLEIPLILGRTF